MLNRSVFAKNMREKKRNSNRPFWPAALIGLAAIVTLSHLATVGAVTLKGTFTSEFYARTTADTEHLRPYASLRAQMPVYSGDRGRVSFKTYLRWTTDILDAESNDPQLFVYDAYFRYQAPRRLGELTLGRQFVYNGAGSDLLDGLRLRTGSYHKATLELIAGSSVDRLDPEKIRSLSDFSVLGGRISYKPITGLPLSLSWHRRERDGEISCHRLGLDGSYSWRQYRFYGRLARDLIDKSLATVQFRTSYRNRPWYFSAEYLSREPSVPGNSVFSLIDSYSFKQFRFVARRSLPHRLKLNTQLQLGLFENDNSWRTGLGLSSMHWRVDWFHQSGCGDNNSLRGSLNLSPIKGWTCYSGVSLSRYRVQMDEDTNDAHAFAFGASRRIAGLYALRVETQLVRNADYSYNTRLYIRFSRDFSFGGDEDK